ncbi:prepilin-type N-terminal cleavage/methylation domain-containing protein [Pseudomonas sp. CFBP 13711]|uniref:GspH/FimT family pseudopilin n=1 Tax=unclassified Pseudomonas TaxID=196821 RepID=UPI00177F74CA|nr:MULTISPECIES: GspH/FimT family pseudopilin [unclassified Pseudomonas]MBD8709054.1 prepilin-type N-terminal cleavage/methylation domain-containing protein [Pseudomonas sp. CFBP 13711]MBD8714090.1 prepilin-type N-terminal cleavage/methylation domain-containing protein [Pseudomonas sp. CFBP 13715]
MNAPVASRGFTLLEMLVVIVLMSIGIGVVGFGLHKGLQQAADRQLLGQMVQALRTTRSAAIISGQPRETSFDLDRRTFQAPGKRPQQWPAEVGVQLNTAADLNAAVAFYPDGSSSGGNLLVFQGERRWRIDIGWLTGSVKSRALP